MRLRRKPVPAPQARKSLLVLVVVVLCYLIGGAGPLTHLIAHGSPAGRFGGVVLVLGPLALASWIILRLRLSVAHERLNEFARERAQDDDQFAVALHAASPGQAGSDHQIEEGRALTRRDPGDWRGWYLLAQGYAGQGHHRRARECLRWSVKLADLDNPAHRPAG